MPLADEAGQAHQRHHLDQQFSERELSSSDCGRMRRQRASAQPIDTSVSQRAPLRITLSESAPYTWLAWNCRHTRAMRRTARSGCRPAGQRGGVDGARRGAGDDGKRVGLATCAAGLAQVGNRLQHPTW